MPFIRSYLGVSIRSEDGARLGTLCAISTEPNAFDESNIAPLSKLAELVEPNITLHDRTRQLSRHNATLRKSARVFHHAEMAANIGSWRIDIASKQSGLKWRASRSVSRGSCRIVPTITCAISPENLTIEVTETMLRPDESGRLRAALHLFDQAGCIIALDDFGTGFSSLGHLRRFPIRKLKTDREFISNIANDKQCRLIIQGIVDMSRNLGRRVVAEGVEAAAQQEFLAGIGCAQALGYRYARPQRLGDLVHHYRSAPSRNTGLTHAA